MQGTSVSAPSNPMVDRMLAYVVSVRRLRSRRQNPKERHCNRNGRGERSSGMSCILSLTPKRTVLLMYVATVCILYLLSLSRVIQTIDPSTIGYNNPWV